jgi:hypothetical protein
MTPEQHAVAESDWEAFKRDLNGPRRDYRLIYPD